MNRAVLSAADLATYAERYGAAATFVDFRARLRCHSLGNKGHDFCRRKRVRLKDLEVDVRVHLAGDIGDFARAEPAFARAEHFDSRPRRG